jgi:hypothetical protein
MRKAHKQKNCLQWLMIYLHNLMRAMHNHKNCLHTIMQVSHLQKKHLHKLMQAVHK